MKKLNDNQYAKDLLKNIQTRCDPLINDNIMLAARFLDFRFQFQLDNVEKDIAKTTLHALYEKFKNILSVKEPTQLENKRTKKEECVSEKEDPDLEYILNDETVHTYKEYDFKEELEAITKQKKINANTEILTFWKDNYYKSKHLYQLATSILSIPATQVTVERSFSDLKFVYSDLRNKLSTEILADIIFLRINKRLL